VIVVRTSSQTLMASQLSTVAGTLDPMTPPYQGKTGSKVPWTCITDIGLVGSHSEKGVQNTDGLVSLKYQRRGCRNCKIMQVQVANLQKGVKCQLAKKPTRI